MTDTDALEQARDPRTSPERLAHLATHEDASVRLSVAANPSTSRVTIEALLNSMHGPTQELIDVLLDNDSLSHWLDDPIRLRRLTGPLPYRLASSPALTSAFWDALRLHRWWAVRLLLLRSPVAPPDAWTRLALPTEGTWDLSHDGIESDDLECLARYPVVTAITHLNLGESYLNRDSLLALIHSPNFPRLVTLDLSGNRRVAEVIPELARTTSFPELTELTLTGCDLPDASLTELARSSRHPRLSRLYFKGSLATDVGALELARTTAFRLTHLALANDSDYAREYISDAGAIALAQSPAMAQLTNLDLSGTHTGDDGAHALAHTSTFQLTTLCLAKTLVGDAGVIELSRSASLAGLAHLDLSWTRIGDEGVTELARSQAFQLTTLHLGGNSVSDAGVIALVQSTSLARLMDLDLFATRTSDKGALALARAFLPELQKLDLSLCALGDAVLAELARSSHFPRLTNLRLACCGITDEGAIALARTTAFQLTALHLTGTPVSDAGAITLAQSSAMARLTHLDLAGTQVGDEGALALTRASFFPHLTDLRLANCPLSNAGKDALREAAAHFPRLNLELVS